MRPAVRFHGSKWLLASWIIEHFPPHDCYVEAFGGSAAVLLQKPRSLLEVYNDKDGELVTYFRVLRERPEVLISALKLTPYAKQEWKLSFFGAEDEVEQARRFYVRAYMSIAGATAGWSTGWRRQKIYSRGRDGRKMMTPAAVTFAKVEHLWKVAERLRGVQIECDEAVAVIRSYDAPQALFYLDPPYPANTRGRWKKKAYRYEMTDEEHVELARVVRRVEGMVVISGYRCELYDELYEGWERVERMARINGGGEAMEALWLSPSVAANRLPLFAWGLSTDGTDGGGGDGGSGSDGAGAGAESGVVDVLAEVVGVRGGGDGGGSGDDGG